VTYFVWAAGCGRKNNPKSTLSFKPKIRQNSLINKQKNKMTAKEENVVKREKLLLQIVSTFEFQNKSE